MSLSDPYLEHIHARLIESCREYAVIEQPALAELDNHVMVRHASALYGAAYAASRALILAALGDRASAVELRATATEIAYGHIPLGRIVSIAEPRGGGWEELSMRRPVTDAIELDTNVVSTNEDGKSVAMLDATWCVAPPG